MDSGWRDFYFEMGYYLEKLTVRLFKYSPKAG